MKFSRQEYWSGYQFPSPGDLPNPGIDPRSPSLQVDSLLSEQPGEPNLDVLEPGSCNDVYIEIKVENYTISLNSSHHRINPSKTAV